MRRAAKSFGMSAANPHLKPDEPQLRETMGAEAARVELLSGGAKKKRTPALAELPVSIIPATAHKKRARASWFRTSCLVVAWVLLLVVALCAEMAAVIAVGAAVRMLFVDSLGHHSYDSSSTDR